MSMNNGSNGASTRIEGTELVMERFFNAPAELLYTMYTEPQHVKNWWGPNGWTTENYKMDVRPGGIWHYCMRSEDGQEAWGKALYEKVEKPHLLTYTDTFSDEEGNDAEGFPAMKIIDEFVEEENGTRIISRTVFASEEDLHKVTDMGAVEGMTETFDRLEHYIEETQNNLH